MIEVLLIGGRRSESWLRRWGVFENYLYGFHLSSRTRDVDVEALTTRWFDQLGATYVFTVYHRAARGFVSPDRRDQLIDLSDSFESYGGDIVSLGFSQHDEGVRSPRPSRQSSGQSEKLNHTPTAVRFYLRWLDGRRGWRVPASPSRC